LPSSIPKRGDSEVIIFRGKKAKNLLNGILIAAVLGATIYGLLFLSPMIFSLLIVLVFGLWQIWTQFRKKDGIIKPKAIEWYLSAPIVFLISVAIYSVTFFLFDMIVNESISEAAREFATRSLDMVLMSLVLVFIPIIFPIIVFRLFRRFFPKEAKTITSVAKFGMISGLVYLAVYPWFIWSSSGSTAGAGFAFLPLCTIVVIPIGGTLGHFLITLIRENRQRSTEK